MKFAAGKRHMLVQDPNAAVEAFAEASEALGKIYGETANECGESYFYYGKALLDLARMEAGVIDNVLDGGKKNYFSREIKTLRNRRNSDFFVNFQKLQIQTFPWNQSFTS